MESVELSLIYGEKGISCRDVDFSSEPYSFPVEDWTLFWDVYSNNQLQERLLELIECPDYLEIRDEYCALHIEMNVRHNQEGIRAPRFRPHYKRPRFIPGKKYPYIGKLISNDTQVIDMNWLHSFGFHYGDDDLVHKMLGGDEFDFDAASEFVQLKGEPEKKVGYIGLDFDEQLQMSMIQKKEIKVFWEKLQKYELRTQRVLTSLGKRVHYVRGNEQTWTQLAVATALEQKIIPTGEKLNNSRIANWYSLMTGIPMSRQAVARKLVAMRKYIDLHES